MRKSLKKELEELNACQEAREWVGNKGFKRAWSTCTRGDWMLWYVFKNRSKLSLENMRLITLAKALTAKPVVRLMKDERSIKAVEVAERFGRGEATREELYNAARAAYTASADAYAATRAARAAYTAARAARAAYAAAYYAEAADAAAYDAARAAAYDAARAAAAAADARKNILAESADVCREVFKDVF